MSMTPLNPYQLYVLSVGTNGKPTGILPIELSEVLDNIKKLSGLEELTFIDGTTQTTAFKPFTVDWNETNSSLPSFIKNKPNVITGLTGDVTASGTGNIAATLSASGVTPGTYKSVVVDAKGRVINGTSPTTLAGYGITDAQPLAADLTSIASLSGTSGLLRKTAANTWSLDTSVYALDSAVVKLTGDQTVAGIKTLSSNPVLSAGTANGVAYLNGSKVLTTGSALTYAASGNYLALSDGVFTGLFGKGNQIVASVPASDTAIQSSLGGFSVGTGASNVLRYRITETGESVWYPSGGSEQMRLTSTGLGIGTSSPSVKFVVSNAGANGYEFDPVNSFISSYNRSTSAWTPVTFRASGYTWNINNSSDALKLDSSGNLGLGVTPSAWSSVASEIGYGGNALWGLSANDFRMSTNMVRIGGGNQYKANGAAAMYNQASGGHYWYTAPSGTAGNAITFTQAMTLTAAGNLGVGGITSPTYAVDVGDSASGNMFRFSRSGTEIGSFISGGTPFFGALSNNPLVFVTNATERARIDSSGSFCLGTTTNTLGGAREMLTINSPDLSLTANGIGIKNGTNSTGGAFVRFVNSSDSSIGSISQNTSTSVAYNTASDYRLKNITGPITNSGAYIDSLNPVEGTWKADGSTFVGLIAHEAQEASRTPVATGVKDGEQMQGMDYSSSEIIANLIAELQSVRKRLAAAGI